MNVEICANSRQSAVNAQAGGAVRVELCRQLEVGGTTPTADDIRYCVHDLKLRTHVLVRPRAGMRFFRSRANLQMPSMSR